MPVLLYLCLYICVYIYIYIYIHIYVYIYIYTHTHRYIHTYMPIHIWAQMVKNLPTMQEIWVLSLGQEDPLEKGMATHSSILAWRTPWTDHGITELDTTEQLPHTHTPLSPFPPHLHLISIFTSIFIFISILPTE